MCGIYGVVMRPGLAPDAAVLDRMGQTLIHRGPDGDGVTVEGRAGLGCRRLAIIDVEHGAQPLANEHGDVLVVCNGEIYNHRALREHLERAGHRFRTRSDAEVIPHLYEEHGLDFVDRLEGMFGLALWDARAHRLVLARDRMGEKPLYYATTAAGLLFASEPKAILASGLVDRRADALAICGFLRTGYVAAPRSPFANISALLPGTRLVVEGESASVEPFWQVAPFLAEPPLALDLESAARELRRELERSVEAALVSDVPVGVFLSGGLDSTAVAAIARSRVGSSLDTFTLGFDVPSFDERDHAAQVVRALGTRSHVLTITPELFLDGLRALAPLLDEPIADQSLIPTYLLARYARAHVKVVLVGEGSDELFAGYPTYPGGLLAAHYRRLPPRLRQLLRAATPRLGAPHGNITLRYLLRRFLELAEAPTVARHRAWTGVMGQEQLEKLIAPSGPLATGSGPDDSDTRQGPPARGELDALLGLDLTGYLRDELLTNLDRATMAASLEGRAPFLNHHLVELACRLPAGLKLRGAIGKRVLRRAVADIVPAHTRRRVKRGLAVPLAAWLGGPLLPFVRETLARLDPSVFRREAVQELLDEHVDRRRDNRRELWALLVLQLWVDRNAATWHGHTATRVAMTHAVDLSVAN
jgi:asparagine synthase (glutamine-hydrolysing)